MMEFAINHVPLGKNSTDESSCSEACDLIKYIIIKNQKNTTYEFEVVQNHPDGSCLFRAISQALYRKESRHALVRRQVVDYITDVSNWKKYLPFIKAQHDHLNPGREKSPRTDSEHSGSDTDADADEGENNKNIADLSLTPGQSGADMNSNYYALLRDDSTGLKRQRLQLKSELKSGVRARESSINLKAEYLEYMRSGSAFGTMQEMLAAAEYFHFNLIVIREIDSDWYNIQNFSELGHEETRFFFFTGDSDAGHFEHLKPACRDTLEYDVPNGDYIQVGWNPTRGIIIVKEVAKQTSDDRINASDTTIGGADADIEEPNDDLDLDPRDQDEHESNSPSTVINTGRKQDYLSERPMTPTAPPRKSPKNRHEEFDEKIMNNKSVGKKRHYESALENLDLEGPVKSEKGRGRHENSQYNQRATTNRVYRNNWEVTDFTRRDEPAVRAYHTPNTLEYYNKLAKGQVEKNDGRSKARARDRNSTNRVHGKQSCRDSASNQTLVDMPGCTSSGTPTYKPSKRKLNQIQPGRSSSGGVGFISLTMAERESMEHLASSPKDSKVGQYQQLLKQPPNRRKSTCRDCVWAGLKRIRKGFLCVCCPCIYAKYYN